MSADAESGSLPAYDLDSMETFLRICRMELVLLGGSPAALLEAGIVDGALVCHVQTGMRVRGRFVLPRDWMMLMYLVDSDGTQSWCHGVPMGSGSCVTVLPTGAAEFCLSAGSRALLALLPRKLCDEPLDQSDMLTPKSRLEPGLRLSDHAEAFHEKTLVGLRAGALNADFLQAWYRLHVDSQPQSASTTLASLRARRSRYLVFRKAEDFMLANIRRQIYMQEICDAAGTSERTLRYAFDDLTGNSPGRYLSLLRLCAACRALATADAAEHSVKSVALSCGLWDLSRFADSYRSVFGELPRDTLQRISS